MICFFVIVRRKKKVKCLHVAVHHTDIFAISYVLSGYNISKPSRPISPLEEGKDYAVPIAIA